MPTQAPELPDITESLSLLEQENLHHQNPEVRLSLEQIALYVHSVIQEQKPVGDIYCLLKKFPPGVKEQLENLIATKPVDHSIKDQLTLSKVSDISVSCIARAISIAFPEGSPMADITKRIRTLSLSQQREICFNNCPRRALSQLEYFEIPQRVRTIWEQQN